MLRAKEKRLSGTRHLPTNLNKLDSMSQRLNKFIDSVSSKEVHSCTTVLVVRTDGGRINTNNHNKIREGGSDGADVRAVSHRAVVLWFFDAR